MLHIESNSISSKNPSWLHGVIFLEFFISASLFIFTTIGVSLGEPVSSVFLLAGLQVIIASPGLAHVFCGGLPLLVTYVSLQSLTAVCELIWFVVLLSQGHHGLAVLIAVLFVVQMASVLVALCYRNRTLKIYKHGKVDIKVPELQTCSLSSTSIEENPHRSPGVQIGMAESLEDTALRSQSLKSSRQPKTPSRRPKRSTKSAPQHRDKMAIIREKINRIERDKSDKSQAKSRKKAKSQESTTNPSRSLSDSQLQSTQSPVSS